MQLPPASLDLRRPPLRQHGREAGLPRHPSSHDARAVNRARRDRVRPPPFDKLRMGTPNSPAAPPSARLTPRLFRRALSSALEDNPAPQGA
jgi:hypothetical protein